MLRFNPDIYKENSMKSNRLCLVLMLLTLLMVACQTTQQSGQDAAAHQTSIDRILSSGELRVGTSASQPPLNMKDRNGEIFGLEIDIARVLAKSMGVELTLVEKPFGELLGALEAGDVDIVISGMTILAERNAKVAFVGPYFLSGKSFLTKYQTLARAQSLETIEDEQLTLTALEGSTSQMLVEEFAPDAKLISAASYADALSLLAEDKVDALVADYPFCFYAVLRHPSANYMASITPITYEPLGIALPGDDPLLINLVTNFLNTMRDSGKLELMKKRWFGDRTWMERMAY